MSDLKVPENPQKNRGKIIVRADAVNKSNDEISFFVTGIINNGQAGCLCGADNPYLMISRSRGGDLVANEYIRVK